jgi:hypothetical protein
MPGEMTPEHALSEQNHASGTTQGALLQAMHEGSPVTTPSVPTVLRLPVPDGSSDGPSLPARGEAHREHAQRVGWSLARIAITREALPSEHRYTTVSPAQEQTTTPSAELALQPNAGEPLRKENATGLPDHLKAGIESLSGLSLDDVHLKSLKQIWMSAEKDDGNEKTVIFEKL